MSSKCTAAGYEPNEAVTLPKTVSNAAADSTTTVFRAADSMAGRLFARPRGWKKSALEGTKVLAPGVAADCRSAAATNEVVSVPVEVSKFPPRVVARKLSATAPWATPVPTNGPSVAAALPVSVPEPVAWKRVTDTELVVPYPQISPVGCPPDVTVPSTCSRSSTDVSADVRNVAINGAHVPVGADSDAPGPTYR